MGDDGWLFGPILSLFCAYFKIAIVGVRSFIVIKPDRRLPTEGLKSVWLAEKKQTTSHTADNEKAKTVITGAEITTVTRRHCWAVSPIKR